MKKIFSILLALVTVLGVSATAFAAEDTTGVLTSDGSTTAAGDSADAGFQTLGSFENTNSGGEVLNVAVNDLVLVYKDSAGESIVFPETRLIPGNDYTFEIHRVTAIDAATNTVSTENLTTTQMANNRLRINGKKGTSVISSAKIETKGKNYILEMTTKSNYGTKITDVEYSVQTTKQVTTGTGTAQHFTGLFSFRVGYATVPDETVDSYTEGDIVVIERDYPVYTKKQLDRIAKENNYKPVTLEGEESEWRYEGRISGMSDTNFIYTYDVIPAIVNKFEDQDFKFLTFNAGVSFPSNGTMTVDVSDISGDFDRMYVYLYRNGKLEKLSPSYDSANDEISFRTNYLGGFVITNKEITDTTIIAPTTPDEETDTDNTTKPGTVNPGTGAANTSVALALAMTSIVSAAALARKKK